MNAKVLLVDDEPAVLKCLSTVLTRLGHSVTTAPCGEAAIAQLDQQAFDLVVTDFRMPGLGGDAVVQSLRDRGADAAVLVITGLTDELPDWLRVGPEAVRILAKPFTIFQFHAEVASALRCGAAVPA